MQENDLQLGAVYCRPGGTWELMQLCRLAPWRHAGANKALQIVAMAARGNERVNILIKVDPDRFPPQGPDSRL